MEIVNERENHLIFYIICFNGKDVCVLISGEHGNRNGMVGKGISLIRRRRRSRHHASITCNCSKTIIKTNR